MAVNLLDLSYPRGAGAARGLSAGTVGPGVARGRPLDGLEIDPRGLIFIETQLGGEEPERFPLGLLVGEQAGQHVAQPVAVAEQRHLDVVGWRRRAARTAP